DLRAAAGWSPDDLPAFAALHPGGPKVLEAIADALAFPPALFEPSRRVLARYGNMSAPTFLFVLEDILRETPDPEAPGIYGAMGPGFTADMGVVAPARVRVAR